MSLAFRTSSVQNFASWLLAINGVQNENSSFPFFSLCSQSAILLYIQRQLQQTMYAISQAAYSQVQQEGAQSANSESASSESTTNKDDDVIDAEYTKE